MSARPVEHLAEEHPDAEVQTNKPTGKVVECRECGGGLIVNVFYAPANARCSTCKGEKGADGAAKSTIGAPQPGRTDPAKAVNLADCLINPGFAFARCPVHPDDESHEMELKYVSHSDHYGPSQLVGYRSGGQPDYRQLAQGETVLWQCLKCKATVSYSTTAQTQFLRQNEVLGDKHVNGWRAFLDARPEDAPEHDGDSDPEDHRHEAGSDTEEGGG